MRLSIPPRRDIRCKCGGRASVRVSFHGHGWWCSKCESLWFRGEEERDRQMNHLERGPDCEDAALGKQTRQLSYNAYVTPDCLIELRIDEQSWTLSYDQLRRFIDDLGHLRNITYERRRALAGLDRWSFTRLSEGSFGARYNEREGPLDRQKTRRVWTCAVCHAKIDARSACYRLRPILTKKRWGPGERDYWTDNYWSGWSGVKFCLECVEEKSVEPVAGLREVPAAVPEESA